MLVVTKDVPAALIGPETVILETKDGALASIAAGENWAREFALDRIRLGDVEAVAVRPDKAVEVEKRIQVVAPVVQPAPEPSPIVHRIVFAMGGVSIMDAERARWPGYDFERNVDDIVKAVEMNRAKGRTEIAVVEPARGGNAQEEVRRIETALRGKNLHDAALVRVAERRLLDAA